VPSKRNVILFYFILFLKSLKCALKNKRCQKSPPSVASKEKKGSKKNFKSYFIPVVMSGLPKSSDFSSKHGTLCITGKKG
jgi:hypothetical protein